MESRSSPPIIIDLGDSDYASVYDVLVSPTDELEIKYRYTGNKNPQEVEKLLFSALTKALEAGEKVK